MYMGKLWLKSFIIGIIAVSIIFAAATFETYVRAEKTVDAVFPELVRLVSEDNCLDNTISFSGKTTYQRYSDKLKTISDTSPIIEFRADAIGVPYTSRSSAPQRGTPIHVKLTGYWTITVPVFGGLVIDFPIIRELDVIGIREYRDR